MGVVQATSRLLEDCAVHITRVPRCWLRHALSGSVEAVVIPALESKEHHHAVQISLSMKKVETVALLPTVDVMAMIVHSTAVTRQSSYSTQPVAPVTSKRKQRRHKLKGPREKVTIECRKMKRRTKHGKSLRRERKRTACTEDTKPTLPVDAHTC